LGFRALFSLHWGRGRGGDSPEEGRMATGRATPLNRGGRPSIPAVVKTTHNSSRLSCTTQL